jgi:superfamily II DNA or RNA helicase
MNVSTDAPFTIIYSLFQHEYLGYLFESFVVQLDDRGRLTLRHQNISSKNAVEFHRELDSDDYALIELMDTIQQGPVIRRFYKTKAKPREFFGRVYSKDRPDEALQREIQLFLENRRARILELIGKKMLFEMGNDGEPTWKRIEIMQERASVQFNFLRNLEQTTYYPTITYQGRPVPFRSNSYIICREPAWIVCNGRLFGFDKPVDGYKILPFLSKDRIVVPRTVEDTYYRKFVAPLISQFDVVAEGFDIQTIEHPVRPRLMLSELNGGNGALSLFNRNGNGRDHNGNGSPREPAASADEPPAAESDRILFDLSFDYGPYNFKANDGNNGISVQVEQQEGNYTFNRILRRRDIELQILNRLRDSGLNFRNNYCPLPKSEAISWLNRQNSLIRENGIQVVQKNSENKRYFIGEPTLTLEVRENIDWFDILAVVRFGEFEISFRDLRKIMLKKGNEIPLPNGEIGVIPEAWLRDYSEFFAFMDEHKGGGTGFVLNKHHLALVQDLQTGNLAQVSMSEKLQNLRNFEKIDDEPMPGTFRGTLRPYQKAGYNWLNFLRKYRFGGCLADDMGLGKTVQTLALLQAVKEEGDQVPSLLIMPTSLLYNWDLEARKFTPTLRIYHHTGTNRNKDISCFEGYDLVLTSYGITRLDIEILRNYYFNYIILDESQAIKNPNSIISKAVKKLKSRNRLILTGTPLENSTMDLWSQMTFINPGLLGNHGFFRNEFLTPIEKKNDGMKVQKLNSIIKPFILRRHKSQVATELPEKVESLKLCSMTPAQEELYEEQKSYYRNRILDEISSKGVKKSQILLLQGLTRLRQIANHPRMIDEHYKGDSGKMDALLHMVQSVVSEDHKVLIFSQFVKHLKLLSEQLRRQHIRFAYLDGSTKDRQQQVELFQQDEGVKMFLISLKAGGLGLNLTRAEYVFILDPWWNPAVEQQAIDRAHRIGQENKVFTYKFISRNTVEEKILSLQKRKLRLASELITTEDSFVKDLTREDIELLLA